MRNQGFRHSVLFEVGESNAMVGSKPALGTVSIEDRAPNVVYQRHYEFVYRTARSLGTPEEEADDVAQEVFMVAFRRIEQFREGKMTTWLYRITANVSAHHHRKRARQRAVGAWRQRLGLGGPPCPEMQVLALRDGEAVDQILERMTPKKREVFALFELEELSGEEVAERVGIPIGTVWSRLRHGRIEFLRIGRKLGVLQEDEARA